MKVNSAPLLVLQSNNIMIDPREPFRLFLLQHSLHRVADDLVHVNSGEGRSVMSTIRVVGLARTVHRELPLGRGDSNEEVWELE